MTRQEIIDELWNRKEERRLPTHAYCETTQVVTLRKWKDHARTDQGEPILISEEVSAGTTLKIVMISRLGDFGLTDDLAAEHGYHVRLGWNSPTITNLRLERHP